MVAAAVVGGAVVGGLATSYSGKKAASASEKAAEQNAAVQQYMYDTNRADTAPYRETGYKALDRIASLYGINRSGDQGAPDFSAFYASPDYQFAFDEGSRAVDQSLAKRGLSSSGTALKELTRFGQGLASQQLSNYKNSLSALAGIGQTATSQLGALGANAASNIGNAYQNAGDARASSYLNTGAAVSNAANSYGQYELLKAAGYIQ